MAAFRYESQAKQVVLAFKNGHDTLAKPLAQRLWTEMQQNQLPGSFTVTFVPMRRWRLVQRGYNQAELLARELAKRAQWDFQPLLRRIASGSQRGLSRSARKAQMVSAFLSTRTVPPRVLLVDDVVTTGATAAACCKALKKGGAREVWVAAIAKTPRRG
ncbi:MAG: ComF family protein [Thermoanaerobaculaceae bacterium]